MVAPRPLESRRPRLLAALGLLAAVAVIALLLTWDRALPEITQATGPEPGMSLSAPATVFMGVTFLVTVSADPAPDVEFAAFGSEVLFPEGLKWQQRATCEDEVAPRPVNGLCQAGLSISLGGASHTVISEIAVPPLVPFDVVPGSITPLVELDFVCNTPGSYTLTLTAGSDSPDGAVFADTAAVEIPVKTVEGTYDADGDTTPETHQVADMLVINCVEPPTPTSTVTPTPTPTVTPTPPKIDTDGDGCLDNRENGPDETLGGRRDYLNFWDFFDPNRDRSVTLLDFFAILRHFNTAGDVSPLDPDGPEPPIGEYWALADRGGQAPGGDPWDELPANGSIGLADFLSVLRQFGHTCA